MVKCIITFLTVVFLTITGFSQDLSFSQFYANRINLNPAFIGMDNGVGWSRLVILDQLDPVHGNIYSTLTIFGQDAVRSTNLYPEKYPRITIHTGTDIPLIYYSEKKKKISILPNIKYDVQGNNVLSLKNNFQVITYGAYLIFDENTNASIIAFG